MARLHKPSFRTLLEFAHGLADLSAAAILPHFRKLIAVENKGGRNAFDPVTAADRAAEQVIAKAIAERFPDHAIIGEEFGAGGATGPFRWVIDPIDGTRAFIMGSPMWGTLIGLLERQGESSKPLIGIMNQPFTGERVWSESRVAKWRTADGNVRRIKTRACTSLADAVLTTTHPDLFERGREADGFARVKAQARMTRYGGDCYNYCLLAAGYIDVIVEAGLKTYDIAGLLPILECAGAVATTWDGAAPTEGGRIVVSGDPRLHEIVLKLLNK